MEQANHLRLVTKVARLYHLHGQRQTEIAQRLGISQSRVSRLLQEAADVGVVQTVVVEPPGMHTGMEEEVEQRYGIAEVHVVDTVSDDPREIARDLGNVMATVIGQAHFDARVLGFTSWSSTMRHAASELQPTRSRAERVVEMLGDLGAPSLRVETDRAAQRLADVTRAEPVFLRTPGVVPSGEVREALLAHDPFARAALELFDVMDLAIVGIGPCAVTAPLNGGDNYFTDEQFTVARELGAVGQINLRFLDARGEIVTTPLDDLVIGVTAAQLRATGQRWGAAGGADKHAIVLAAARGGWVDRLVTDRATAEHLLAAED